VRPTVRTGRLDDETGHKDFFILASQSFGKYFVAPLARRDKHGLPMASVPAPRGRASLRHDRVMRIVPVTPFNEPASHLAQALACIVARPHGIVPFTPTTEDRTWPKKT